MINSSGIQFRHLVSHDWTMSQSHFHEDYEINLFISGKNKFFCNDVVYTSQKGDLFLFNDQDLHKNMVEKAIPYDRYIIFFPPTILRGLPELEEDLLTLFRLNRGQFKNKMSLTKAQLNHMVNFLNETIYTLQRAHFCSHGLYVAKLLELLVMIHQYYYDNQGQIHSTQNKEDTLSGDIQSLIYHIQDNLNQPLTLDQLAKQVYLDKYYLCQRFKAETGFTLNQFIINKRILHAQELLKKGYRITEITQAVGYKNDSHFIRTFKKHVGLTPKQYALNDGSHS